MKRITTTSGAVYHLYSSGRVTGGSKNLNNGVLMSGQPELGGFLLIETPERIPLRDMPLPEAGMVPAVQSTFIVAIEDMDDELLA